jgi:hypothetical protein
MNWWNYVYGFGAYLAVQVGISKSGKHDYEESVRTKNRLLLAWGSLSPDLAFQESFMATAPRFRIDVYIHNVLMGSPANRPFAPVFRGTDLPEPVFPRYPSKLPDPGPVVATEICVAAAALALLTTGRKCCRYAMGSQRSIQPGPKRSSSALSSGEEAVSEFNKSLPRPIR